MNPIYLCAFECANGSHDSHAAGEVSCAWCWEGMRIAWMERHEYMNAQLVVRCFTQEQVKRFVDLFGIPGA